MKLKIYSNIELKKAHTSDAAYDIVASETKPLHENGRDTINTGLRVAIPYGYCGILKSRSGLARLGITVEGGVIDAGYRGEVKVILHSSIRYTVVKGDRIAQLMIVPVPDVEFEIVDELPEADRGNNGFGSTGL